MRRQRSRRMSFLFARSLAKSLFAKSLPVLAMTLALAAPSRAQGNRRDQLIEANIEALGDAAKAPAAALALEHLGAAALPALRKLLESPRRLSEPRARIQNALLVVGRLGERGLPAMREVRDILAVDEGPVLRQAVWALSQLVPHLDDNARGATRDLFRQRARALRNGDADFLVAVIHAQIALGRDPPAAALAAAITGKMSRAGSDQVVAACEHLRARPPTDPDDRRLVLAALEARLAAAMERPQLQWQHRDNALSSAGHLAQAWRSVSQQTGGAEIGRALLFHWDDDERRRGILWLKDNGAGLPVRERGDLVGLVWSGPPAIQATCADTLAAWGKAGLPGLPALRRLQQEAIDPAARPQFAAAADAIVAAFAAEAESTRTLLAAIDGALLGKAAPVGALPRHDARTATLWPEILFGAQWCTGTTAAALLDLCTRTGATDAATTAAVLPWIVNFDDGVMRAALSWLACRGRTVAKAIADGEVVLRHAVQYIVPGSERGAGIETLAWVAAPPGAGSQVLVAALAEPDLRLACRALASLLLEHPEELAKQRARLLALLQEDGTTPQPIKISAELEQQVRLLAAVALVAQPEPFDVEQVEREVRSYCGVAPSELPQWYSEQRSRGTLAAWLDSVEAECRRQLGCVEGTWPTLAGAR